MIVKSPAYEKQKNWDWNDGLKASRKNYMLLTPPRGPGIKADQRKRKINRISRIDFEKT